MNRSTHVKYVKSILLTWWVHPVLAGNIIVVCIYRIQTLHSRHESCKMHLNIVLFLNIESGKLLGIFPPVAPFSNVI